MKTNTPYCRANKITGGLQPIVVYCLLFVLGIGVCLLSSCNISSENKKNTGYYDSLIDAATPLLRSGKIKEAFRFVDSGYSSSHKPDKHDLYNRYTWKASVLFNMAQYHEAMAAVDSAITDVDRQSDQDRSDYANALLLKGNIWVKLNESNKAYACFYEGRSVIEKSHDTCAFSQYNAALAFVLYKQQKYKDAAKYWGEQYLQAVACRENGFGNLFVERQGALDNIGLCYEHLEMYDSALEYYTRALEFIDKNESKYPSKSESIEECRVVIKGNLGNVYLKLGAFKDAEALFKENIAFNHKDGYDNMDGQLTILKLAQLYIDANRYNEAYELIKYIRNILDKAPNAEEEKRWRKLIWHYYDATGNTKEAFKQYKKLCTV